MLFLRYIICLERDYLFQYNKAKSHVERYFKKVTDDRLSEFIV